MKKFLIRAEVWLGTLANAVGVPGLVSNVEYRSALDGTKVSVKKGCLYTVISVNGADVYVRRFGGSIDAVTFSRISDFKSRRLGDVPRPIGARAAGLTATHVRM
jgi:hypothetical protein